MALPVPELLGVLIGVTICDEDEAGLLGTEDEVAAAELVPVLVLVGLLRDEEVTLREAVEVPTVVCDSELQTLCIGSSWAYAQLPGQHEPT